MIRNLISMTIVFIFLTAFISCGGGGSGGNGDDSDDSDDNDLNPSLVCPDNDGDGYADATCDGDDCDDRNPDINPLAPDICGDNIDQNCDGSDKICSDGGAAAHASLTWDGSAGICLSCHTDEAEDVYASTHYQWQGDALYMSHGPLKQGKPVRSTAIASIF